MELIIIKCISAGVLWLITFFMAVTPLFIWRKTVSTNNAFSGRLLSLLSCAGGGVFLGTCFLHLLPEVQEQMAIVFQMLKLEQKYPVSEFLLTFGFLIILVIEQIILVFQAPDETTPVFHNHQHHNHGDHANYGTISPGASGDHQQPNNADHVNYEPIPNGDFGDHNHSVHEDHRSHSSLRSIVLVFALSLHSLFEGLAIGLQPTAKSVYRVLIAVSIHKCVIAFTLGLNLIHSRLSKSVLMWSIGIFVTMSPLGACIGSIITDLSQGLNLAITSGVLQGIAAGTFVYVTFFEILPHELNSMLDKIWKVLFLIIGFSFSCLLVLFVSDS